MKKLMICFTLVLFQFGLASAQDIHDRWQIKGGGELTDQVNAMVADEEGNLYVTGSFQGQAKFGDLQVSSRGDTDMYIAKYNAEGDLLWFQQGGSTMNVAKTITEFGTALTLVNNKYLYVTGVFSGKAGFDNFLISSNGLDDIFIAKYDIDGRLHWVKGMGSNKQDMSHTIAHDDSGNVFVGGYFQGTMESDQKIISAQNDRDGFVLKLDETGKTAWIKSFPSSGKSEIKSVAISGNDCIVSGEFNGQMKVESFTIKRTVKKDLFLSIISEDGKVNAARNFGSSDKVSASDMVVSNERIIVTGGFTGGMSVNDETFFTKGNSDIYLAAFDKNLNPVWFRQVGGSGRDKAGNIVVSDDGNISITGTGIGTLHFTSSVSQIGNGGDDGFVANYSSKGEYRWSQLIGSEKQDRMKAITSISGELYVAGSGRWDGTPNEHYSREDSDVRVAKLDYKQGQSDALRISLYPNPAKDLINIQDSFEIGTPKIVEVIDLSGNIILTKTPESQDHGGFSIDVSQLSSGIYSLRLKTSDNSITQKFIKL